MKFGLIAIIAGLFAKVGKSHRKNDSHFLQTNNAYHQRMSLGGLPPKWKGKRMARIMRGGK